MEEIEVEEEGVPNVHTTHQEKAAKVAELKKHWRQHFQRLQDAIDKGSETVTPANNILNMYTEIRNIGEDFFQSILAQSQILFPKLANLKTLVELAKN